LPNVSALDFDGDERARLHLESDIGLARCRLIIGRNEANYRRKGPGFLQTAAQVVERLGYARLGVRLSGLPGSALGPGPQRAEGVSELGGLLLGRALKNQIAYLCAFVQRAVIDQVDDEMLFIALRFPAHLRRKEAIGVEQVHQRSLAVLQQILDI